MSETPLIDLQHVSKVYASGDMEVRALDDVSVSIGRREFVAGMGSSGSGKSTLMNIVGCLDRPTLGSYLLDGRDVSGLSRDELAHILQPDPRLRLPELQPAHADDGTGRTSSCP